ncbi:hypothetical protein H9L12_01480 [Sphingomonas rhizophila]|uniref:Putative Flp pilus-assembly TadG-like N-terminal domain-containing protein n=1 Tax=Sphingomonas rhizophila TaxID=2071607 RepID=A0A7G9SBW0_9SPHN|nr:pilus assembly protein TadG-related protein [Sphingomonas rhizophila]QNN65335.1 hypothetical protein H9L12_01480 [Sphingomonas rhizophila]
MMRTSRIRWPLVSRCLWRDDRGASLLVTAVALPVIVAALGLAIDVYQWTVTKRQIQQSADAAAIAGAYAAVQGADVDEAVSDAAAQSTDSDHDALVSATMSPPGHDGDPFAVGVHIEKPGSLFFTSLFLSKPIAITADAVATVKETNDFCVYGLGSGEEPAIELRVNSTVEAECQLASNAEGPNSVTADPTATLKAARLLTFGGIAGGELSSSNARPFALRQKDPMRELVMPDIPTSGCPNATYNSDVSGVSIKPGCYGNLIINGNVNLEPGNYVLNRGNLLVGPNASVNCDGCTIFLTTDIPGEDNRSVGRVKVEAGATINLTAPRDGDYSGVVMYQDRRASSDDKDQESEIGASSTSRINGIVYFPNRPLKIAGDGSRTFECARLLGRRLVFEGRVIIARGCTSDTGKVVLNGAEVRLVG